MTEIGFGLGSNVGDKGENIRRALARLFAEPGIGFAACSSLYRTRPWGYEDQDWFANLCAVGRTALEPRELLARVKGIESDLGREETFRWGPRVIDIDLLFHGERLVEEADLSVPHRELLNRDFVVVPLAEIRPDLHIAGVRIGDAARRFDPDALQVIAPPWRP